MPRLDRAYDGKLTMGVLSVALFCSGHTYFVQRMPELLGLEPYAVHTTFQYSGTPGKRNRMRERHLWVDDDAYFRHPAGFLSYAADVPKELLVAAENVGKRSRDGGKEGAHGLATDGMGVAFTSGNVLSVMGGGCCVARCQWSAFDAVRACDMLSVVCRQPA